MRPTIAVTTSARSGWRIFPLVALNLWLTGARAVRWGTGRPSDLSDVDGVIIGGGDDIGPDLYGGELRLSARIDAASDTLERGIAETALATGVPLLGICRGAQMLNVAAGGTLHQDAWDMYPDAPFVKTILPRRQVHIREGSLLARHAGTAAMAVNALHTQAVDRLGQGLRVSARDTHGMVQAIERTRDPFCIGVQWHPEHLFYARRQRAIFRALVIAARAYARNKGQVAEVNKVTNPHGKRAPKRTLLHFSEANRSLHKVIQFLARFFLRLSVFLLDQPGKLFFVALSLFHLVIGQVAILLAKLAFELSPVAHHLIAVHVQLSILK